MSIAEPVQGVIVVDLPRWLELRDRTPGEDRYAPRRVQHYVISPTLGVEDAQLLAGALNERAHLERSAMQHSDALGFILVGGVLALVLVVAQHWPLWIAILIIGLVAMFYRAGDELNADLERPLDLDVVQDRTDTVLFYRIHTHEYHLTRRVASRGGEHTKAVHEAMWRAYMLRDIATRSKDAFESLLVGLDPTSPDVAASREKVNDLIATAQSAHEALVAMIDPRLRTRGQTLTSLVELSQTIDAALAEHVLDVDTDA